MSTDYLIFLSVPGLRPRDVNAERTPTLHRWASDGAMAELTPSLPCVTSPVQASMWTGRPPGEHGVIANGFFHRDRREVEFWVAHNDVIGGEQIWETIRRDRPGFTSAVWHAQNIKGAAADFIVTPAPIHEPDGTTRLWCYSKPDGLYQELLDARQAGSPVGHFPLQHYWGPLANIESTRWILEAALWLIGKRPPNFHWIYIPHLDYASQKYGPDSEAARTALTELDAELARFAEGVVRSEMGNKAVFLVAGEYALTDVRGVIHPNRILREAGLLRVEADADGELVDLATSPAFAMVDHQLAHVFVRGGAGEVQRVAEVFRSVEGIAGVFAGDEPGKPGGRGEIGLAHDRAGEIILVARDTHWFTYYWWLDDAAAPAFARTVDIHRKPGYDAVELFFDPATRGIPLDAGLVKGSHGAPAESAAQRTALICSAGDGILDAGRPYRDTDLKRVALQALGISVFT